MGTTWPWARAVYDNTPDGHFRIEMRALPSGPTVKDMMANAALMVGLAAGTSDLMPVVLPAIPFKYAEHNFYRAAKRGLDAQLIWPKRGQTGLSEESVADVYARMRPYAVDGLDRLGVDAGERDHWLSVIDARLERRMTGARWQRETVAILERNMTRREALRQMLLLYHKHNRAGHPVAEWPMP
jgi:gamma-glutamyl:cysteine ligase YbdK (ATP-grasp superfamily)